MTRRAGVDERCRVIGASLLESMQELRAGTKAPTADPLVAWIGCDEARLDRLCRFALRYPGLSSGEAIVTAVERDFGSLAAFLPDGARRKDGSPEAVRAVMKALADRFIAGRTLADGLAEGRRAWARGWASTFDVLGEAITTQEAADANRQAYLRLFDAAVEQTLSWPACPRLEAAPWGPVPRANVSLKLSSFCPRLRGDRLDESFPRVAAAMRQLFLAAKEKGVFVNVDMERSHHLALTIHTIQTLLLEPELRDWTDVALVVQTYLRDSLRHYEDMLVWARRRGAPIHMRIVKGAYWDQEMRLAKSRGEHPPVWQRKEATDASFERVVAFVLENETWLHPLVATHNPRSAAWALACAEAAGLGPDALEFQGLRGFGDTLRDALVGHGARVRVYAPVGDLAPGAAYLSRRIREALMADSVLPLTWKPAPPATSILKAPDARLLWP